MTNSSQATKPVRAPALRTARDAEEIRSAGWNRRVRSSKRLGTAQGEVTGDMASDGATTVELFCGIGGFRLAADRLGLRTVWANDVDPRASRVYRDRFGPEAFREGDVRRLLRDVPEHELLTAGFPCQPFSSAGKKRGVRDPRGTLFQAIVDVLRRRRPRAFVLENVKRLLTMERGTHFATILAALTRLPYRVEWRLVNARDFGLAQNRERVTIVGVRDAARRGDGHADELRLVDPSEVAVLSEKTRHAIADESAWTPIESHGQRFATWGVARRGRFVAAALAERTGSSRVTLRSVLEADVAPQFDFTESTLARLKSSKLVERFVAGVEILGNQNGGARMGYTVFGIDGVAPTLTATPSRHYERYRIAGRYRRLTNVEYARLQGFPDDHCAAASIYDQYALYGNAVPPPLAEWALRRTLRAFGDQPTSP